MIELRLELPPTTNASFRVGKGRFYETDEYKNWKMVAQLQARTQCGHQPSDQEIRLVIEMYQVFGGDIDGRLKPLLDALQGVVYDNDKQVVEILVRKFKALKKQGAKCIVRYELPQLGLFE